MKSCHQTINDLILSLSLFIFLYYLKKTSVFFVVGVPTGITLFCNFQLQSSIQCSNVCFIYLFNILISIKGRKIHSNCIVACSEIFANIAGNV